MSLDSQELKPASSNPFVLPPDPRLAAITLQQYLQFSCSGLVEVTRVMEEIPGWFTVRAGAALYSAALLSPEGGEIVEIGSFKGRSTAVLGYAVKAIRSPSKVYAVDPHIGSEEHQPGKCFADMMPKEGTTFFEFLQNMEKCGHNDVVIPKRLTSEAAAGQWDGKPIRLLFIDGDHSIEGCHTDFVCWERYIMPGGLIILHDVGDDFPGPKYIVDTFFRSSKKYLSIFQVDGLHVAMRIGQ